MRKLWYNIFSTQAESGNSSKQERNVYLELGKMKGIKFRSDDYGNILVTRGNAELYPLFTAHLDTVDKIHRHYSVIEKDGIAIAVDNNGKRLGIGGIGS